ncbi:HTH domain-containing protein [Sinosporangium album]|uniref:HTH domain-containing protein n=1 Tax=Sinosporangium album TaxID=504805 RepID=A0A1G8DEZ6_9ACTN|nr:HTH domain-containing protein [Sinosporangium album]
MRTANVLNVWHREGVSRDLPARILRLLSLLQTGREWGGGELAERLGVSGRTVRRDVERLRELGYRVDGTTGTAGGYRLASGRDLPPLLLSDDEAVAVAAGLATAADGTVADVAEASVRALAKLRQVLPSRLRGRAGAATSRRVEPYGLVVSHGLWYLVAYDPDRSDWRTFRADRLADPRPTGRRFTPRRPAKAM